MGNRYTCKQTFEDWCLENNKQDYLDLWDYELNDVKPSEIPFGTKNRYYFKCPDGIHKSDTRRISDLTYKPRKLICKECLGHNGGVKRPELTGMKFGELTVLKYNQELHNKGKDGYWLCECSCGEKISVLTQKLKEGLKRICGKAGKHKYQMLSPEEQHRCGSENYYWKKAVKEKTQNICVISGEQLDDNEIHHIFPYAQYPDLRFDSNNGVCIAKKYHSIACEGSFHRVYGTRENNTPENFQDYVNEKRRELGNYEFFDVNAYVYPYDEDNLEIGNDLEYIY